MVHRDMPCPASTQPSFRTYIRFALLLTPAPVHSQPHPYCLVLYGCTTAALGASKEEDGICSAGSLHDWAGCCSSWEHCREEPWGMNPGLRLPGDGFGLSWEWLGFIVAIRRDTSTSTSLCTGKNSEMPLAPLMSFSYFSVCILPFVGSDMGFSGEGKQVSIVGS